MHRSYPLLNGDRRLTVAIGGTGAWAKPFTGLISGLGLFLVGICTQADILLVDPEAKDCGEQTPYCAIQAAINAARPGDTLRLRAGLYDLWEEILLVNKSLSLVGAGEDATILDGGGAGPGALIEIGGDAREVRIESLTLKNRKRGGAAFLGGGGIDHAAGALFLKDVSLQANRGGFGGALHIHGEAEHAKLDRVTIVGNSAISGGGVAIRNVPLASVQIMDSRIEANAAVFTGGGLFLRNAASITLSNVAVTRNESGNSGGGIFFWTQTEAAELSLRDSIVSGNSARYTGGIDVTGEDAKVLLRNVTLKDNISRDQPETRNCSADPQQPWCRD